MRSLIVIIASLLTASMLSCSSNHRAQETDVTETVDSTAPADSEIFMLGQEAACSMLVNCRNMDEIEQELLDVKARIHLINTRVGASAAEDFTKGFVEYIKAHDDSLSARLF